MKILSGLILLLLSGIASSQPLLFQEGIHYQAINPTQRNDDPNTVEVVEVFGYLCPHCATFQPHIHPWSSKLGDQVSFHRMPVIFRPSWEPFARAYYTAEALGVIGEAHQALFDALHRQHRQLRSPKDLAEFFTQFGVTQEDYLATSSSSEIDAQILNGARRTQQYGITGTPSVVVNGKYLTTGAMAGSYPNMIDVIDFLVTAELAKLPTAAQGDAVKGTGK